MASFRRERGFTYLAILFIVAVTGLGVSTLGEAWSRTRQRQKEAELLWVGNQFKQAIGLYYERSPGAAKRYPAQLEDLLEDKRFVTTQRYLRRIYADPMTGKPDWDLVSAPDGGIVGVKSRSASRVGSIAIAAKNLSREFIYEPQLAIRSSQ